MSGADEGPDWGGLAIDADGRLVDLGGAAEVVTYGPPPTRTWVPVTDVPRVRGRRACLMNASGPIYDIRCASDVFTDSGGLYVNLVEEAQWYRWLETDDENRPDRIPRATCVRARHVWIDIVE